MKWHAVLFDLDDTLYSRVATLRRTIQRLLEVHAGSDIGESLASAVDRIINWDIFEYQGTDGNQTRLMRMEQIKSEFPAITAPAEELLSFYRAEMIRQIIPDSAMEPVLGALDRTQTPWGVITNGDRFQLRKITSLGLDSRPAHVTISAVEGWRKPDARLFNLALERMGVEDPRTALMVGDNPVADIQGAMKVGMETAWLTLGRSWNQAEYQPGIRLNSLSDLLEHLD